MVLRLVFQNFRGFFLLLAYPPLFFFLLLTGHLILLGLFPEPIFQNLLVKRNISVLLSGMGV